MSETEELVGEDPGFPVLTTGKVKGIIQNINLEEHKATVHVDDGTVHDVVYAPTLVQEGNIVKYPDVNDGDRVVWDLVAEDGIIMAYDIYLDEDA